MKTITAREAKNSFGKFLDMAQREPVVVTKNSRPVAVLVSLEDIEDQILLKQAIEANEDGYLSDDESENFLTGLINAKS